MDPEITTNSERERPSGTSSQSRAAHQEFLCPYCGDSFKRLEHLFRHKLSHSDDRPYQCPTCGKAFTRKDTLNRHIPIHASKPDGTLDRRSAVSRVSRACVRCARSRLRCDGENPCSRCSKKNAECAYPGRSRKRIAAGSRFLSSSASVDGDSHELAVREDGAPPHFNKCPQSQYNGFQLPPRSSVTDSEEDDGKRKAYNRAVEKSPFGGAGNGAPISQLKGQQVTSTMSQQNDMPPPYDVVRSRSSSNRQNPFGDGQSDFAVHQSPHSLRPLSQITTPQTANTISHDGLQSAISFPDPEMGSKDIDPMAMDFTYSPPWDTTFEFMDWMTFDPNFEFGAMATSFDPAVHASLPPAEPMPRVEQYSLPNLTDPNRYAYSDRAWGRKSSGTSATTPDQVHGMQSSMSSSSYSTPPHHHVPLPTPGYQPKQELFDTPKPIAEPAVPYRTKVPLSDDFPTADWEPVKNDNIVSFPDFSNIPQEVLEAEEFGHVGNMTQQTYDEMVNCLDVTTDQKYRQFRPFTNAQFPSKRAMDCFMQVYFEYFHPTFPILHQPTFEPATTPWLLLLAAATIGCRYSKAPGSGKGANALQEFLRRAIALTCEGDNSKVRQPWLAQSLVLNSIGMTYSGDKRLLEISQAGRNFAITLCRRNGSMKPTDVQPLDLNCHGVALEDKWRQWVQGETRRRLGFSVWLIDTGLVTYLDYIPAMAPDEPQQQLPCHEGIWSACNAEEWKDMLLKDQHHGALPNVPAALRQIRQNVPIASRLGDFARLIVTFAIYRCTQVMLQQAKNPFMHPSYSIFNSTVEEDWTKASLKALNSLLPTHLEVADSSDDPLKSSLSCHIHLVSLLLLTPRKDLLAFAHTHRPGPQFGPPGQSPKENHLSEWLRADYGRRARRAVLHAGALFKILRQQPSQALHEPITALLATLVIWAFSQLSIEPEPYQAQSIGGNAERGSIRLDRALSDDMISAWVEGHEGLRGHLTDVGNVCGQDAADRLLYVGTTVLQVMETWALSQGLAAWLTKLRVRTTAPAAPEVRGVPAAGTAYS